MQSVHLSYRSVESSLGLIYSHSTRTHSSLKSAAGLQDAAYPVQSFTYTKQNCIHPHSISFSLPEPVCTELLVRCLRGDDSVRSCW